MSCQQVPTTPAFNLYPRSVQVGEFEVAIDGGIWVAIRVHMQQWKRWYPWVKRFARQLQHHTAVFANGIQHRRVLRLSYSLSDDVNAFCF